MIAPHSIGPLLDAFGRPRACDCCGWPHLLVATVEDWIAETSDAPDLQQGFLLAGSGLRRDARLSLCHECFCIQPLSH